MRTRGTPKPESSLPARHTCLGFIRGALRPPG
jgi:hypothetical protein